MRNLIALLLCWPLWVGAAEYWADLAGTGTGAADGSDVDNLCAGEDDADCAPSADDTVYLCNEGATGIYTDTAGSDGSPITYDWSCPGGTAGSINGGESETDCLIIGASYVTHKNGTVHDCTTTGVWVDGAITEINVEDFTAYNIPGTSDDIGNGVCFIVDNKRNTGGDDAGTSAAASNITFLRDTAYNCGRMGFDTQTTGSNIKWVDSVAYENGGNYTGGGFYSHPFRFTVTSGWTVVSGDVYGRASLSVNDDVDVVYWVDDQSFLTEVACGGTINVGEFCYNPGNAATGYLRVNIGENPNGQEIQFRRGPLTGVRWENVTAYNNRAPVGDAVHGTGLQIDDLNTGAVVQGGKFYGNDGAGIEIFRSKDNTVNSAIVWGNGVNTNLNDGDRSNIQLQGTGNVLNNVTSNNSATFGVQQGEGSSTCNNCALTNNGTYGARAVLGAITLNNAALYGNGTSATSEASGGSVTNNDAVTADPQYAGGPNPTTAEGFKLKSTSPLIDAATCVYTTGCVPYDYGGRRARVPADIGAWQRN